QSVLAHYSLPKEVEKVKFSIELGENTFDISNFDTILYGFPTKWKDLNKIKSCAISLLEFGERSAELEELIIREICPNRLYLDSRNEKTTSEWNWDKNGIVS